MVLDSRTEYDQGPNMTKRKTTFYRKICGKKEKRVMKTSNLFKEPIQYLKYTSLSLYKK